MVLLNLPQSSSIYTLPQKTHNFLRCVSFEIECKTCQCYINDRSQIGTKAKILTLWLLVQQSYLAASNVDLKEIWYGRVPVVI